jgi:hypothetical protein
MDHNLPYFVDGLNLTCLIICQTGQKNIVALQRLGAPYEANDMACSVV